MSVDHVLWLLGLLDDQYSLGGVSLLAEHCLDDDAETPAMAWGEESATAESAASWDFVASAWVAAGEQLKFEKVSAREAAALAVDKAAWLVPHAEKENELAQLQVSARLGRPVMLGWPGDRPRW